MDKGAKAANDPNTIAIHKRLEREIVLGLSIELFKEEPKFYSFPSYIRFKVPIMVTINQIINLRNKIFLLRTSLVSFGTIERIINVKIEYCITCYFFGKITIII